MADGKLEGIWPQLYYATRALSPVRLVLKVTLFLLLHCTGVFLCFWGVLTRLDQCSTLGTAFVSSNGPSYMEESPMLPSEQTDRASLLR